MTILNKIKFDSNGLVPVVAVDSASNQVLMVAYANKLALEKTIKTGDAYYYSRSKNQLWKKGEISGHIQKVVSITTDCDEDTILYRVVQTGPACHTNAPTCFFNEIKSFKDIADIGVLVDCEKTIKERKVNPQEGSYTNYLLQKGTEKVCKKIAEEAGEAIIAAIKKDKKEIASESADLLYHLLVLLSLNDLSLVDVLQVLKERREKERKENYTDKGKFKTRTQ